MCMLSSKNGQHYFHLQPLLNKIQPYQWKEPSRWCSFELPLSGRLRKHFLELGGYWNVVSNWTVKKTFSQAWRLMLVGTDWHVRTSPKSAGVGWPISLIGAPLSQRCVSAFADVKCVNSKNGCWPDALWTTWTIVLSKWSEGCQRISEFYSGMQGN